MEPVTYGELLEDHPVEQDGTISFDKQGPTFMKKCKNCEEETEHTKKKTCLNLKYIHKKCLTMYGVDAYLQWPKWPKYNVARCQDCDEVVMTEIYLVTYKMNRDYCKVCAKKHVDEMMARKK